MDEQQGWEKFAEEVRAGAERRVEENKRAKVGDDVEGDTMMEAIGAIGFSECRAKRLVVSSMTRYLER